MMKQNTYSEYNRNVKSLSGSNYKNMRNL